MMTDSHMENSPTTENNSLAPFWNAPGSLVRRQGVNSFLPKDPDESPLLDFLESSACRELVAKGFLLPVERVSDPAAGLDGAVALPAVPFTTYPFEWTLPAFKAAAR